jgi:protein TonB
MTERKPCVRCTRPIDGAARTCVFCNWDQSTTPPTASAQARPYTPPYIPPADTRARNKILGITAFAAVLIIAFVVGSLVHGFEPSRDARAAQPKAAPVPAPQPRPEESVTLVPLTESAPTSTQLQPDATAMLSQPYSAQQQASAQAPPASVPILDPRMVTSNASASDVPARRRQTPSAPIASRDRTEPVPQYQPVPSLHVDRDTTARLGLTVGADGRVRDVNVIESVAGETPRLINAVQNWRFRPATIDGRPVASKFTVKITFHAS